MKITIEKNVAAPVADVWRAFNDPDDIVQWDASDNWQTTQTSSDTDATPVYRVLYAHWHTTWASNDLKVGGKLLLRIEAKDGNAGFDLVATYTQIEPNRLIEFREDDGRLVRLEFVETDAGVTIRQTFDAEAAQPEDQQRSEWQSVLDRFARHVEALTNS